MVRFHRRAVTNIIATMFIFGIMVAAMGVLYSSVAPTIIGYESNAQNTNQEFVFQAIADAVNGLATSAEGSLNRVHIISNSAIYSITSGYSVAIGLEAGGVPLLNSSNLVPVTDSYTTGAFHANLTGTYQTNLGVNYLNRVGDENSFLLNATRGQANNYVMKAYYTYTDAAYTLYFRASINVVQTGTNAFTVTLLLVHFTFNTIGSATIDFPVDQSEWSLRLRRQASTTSTFVVNGLAAPLQIVHSVGGTSMTSYSFPSTTGATVTIKFVDIPILFSI